VEGTRGAHPLKRPSSQCRNSDNGRGRRLDVCVVLRVRLLSAIAAVSLPVVLASCGGPGADASNPDSTDSSAAKSSPGGTLPVGPSALLSPSHPDLPAPLVDPGDLLPGGPPPDGIPAIDEPVFVAVDDADLWLDDREAVAYLELGGEVHAYPVQILIWHEIVNDEVGGTPVSVTYCPLCNSAVSYRRVVDGIVTTFGTSGRLYASALVMYDRATESLWTHFDGRAVAGVLTGHVLEPIPSPLLAWADFKAAFPEGVVLDRDTTGYVRPYGDNPYGGYDKPDTFPFLFRGDVDGRARAKQRVVGVVVGDVARAWTLEAISGGSALATNATVGDAPVAIFWKAGQVSALDTGIPGEGSDVGSVGVFSPVVGDRVLTFTSSGEVFRDQQTGTTWDITGSALAGPLAGSDLEQIHHFDTFWFAWSTYQPGTDLVDA